MKKPFPAVPSRPVLIVQFGALYLLLAMATIYLSRQPGNIGALCFANALGAAYLINQPRSRGPLLLACAACATLIAHLISGDPLSLSTAFVPANLLEILLAARLLRRSRSDKNFDKSPQQYLRFFVLACCIPPLIGATVGAGLIALQGFAPYSTVWPLWFAGSAIGSTGMLPIALLMLGHRPDLALDRTGRARTAMFMCISAIVCILALLYTPFPFLAIMVTLFIAAASLDFASSVALVWISSAVAGTMLATGHFVPPQVFSNWQKAMIYVPLLLFMLPPMVLAASVNQGKNKDKLRARFEDALERNNQKLQTIIDHMPAMVGYWDSELRNRFGNHAYFDWFGFTPEQIRGKHISEVIGEEKYALNLRFMEAALRGEASIFERIVIDPAGRKRHALTSYVPDMEDGKALGFYTFVTDISPLKMAQREQLEAQIQLQGIIDSASEFAIIATGLDGIIQVFSPGAERMLGYHPEELIGQKTPALIHLPEDIVARGLELRNQLGYSMEGFDVFTAMARQGHAEKRELTYVRKDGSHLPVKLVVSAIRDPHNQIIGFLGIANDITRQANLQSSLLMAKEQAEAASLAKSQFVANMSHEIRTPLNAVLGLAYLLDSPTLIPEQKKYVDMIRASGQSLLSIVNDILDFSKVEAGRMELSLAPFRLDHVLDAVANIMTVNAREKDLELAIGIDSGVPWMVTGDTLRLQQVLINLVDNAIKFTDRGTVSVLVTAAKEPGNLPQDHVLLQFRIRDTGIGMDAAQQDRLFAPFSQGDSSISRRYGGTGLGLAISRRLTEMMGGRIEVRSVLGEGTEFDVFVPVRVSASDRDINPDKDLDGLHFFVVEANRTSREYLCKTIAAWGSKSDHAESVAEALKCLGRKHARGERYDAILIDRKILGVDGLARMQPFREFDSGTAIPLLLMDGAYAHGAMRDRRNLAQADAVLVKPVTGAGLFATLRNVLARYSEDQRKSSLHQSEHEADQSIAGAHFLLVEDNPLNQMVASGILRRAGATLDVAENGRDALDLLRNENNDYDLVLMDVQMPVMDGFAAASAIREELKLTLPILAMTAGVMLAERDQCIASGMDGFIAKPIDVAQMLKTIATHLPARTSRNALPEENSSRPSGHRAHSDQELHLQQLFMIGKDNPDYRRKMATLMLETVEYAPVQVREARLAWREGRFDDCKRLLHAVRGSTGTLGAKQFADLSLAIENEIRTGQMRHIAIKFDAAERSLNEALSATQSWLEKQDIFECDFDKPHRSVDLF